MEIDNIHKFTQQQYSQIGNNTNNILKNHWGFLAINSLIDRDDHYDTKLDSDDSDRIVVFKFHRFHRSQFEPEKV